MRTGPVVVLLIGLIVAAAGCAGGVDPEAAAAIARDRAGEVERALPADVRVERSEEVGECTVGLITATQDQFFVTFEVAEPLERAEQVFEALTEELGPGHRNTERRWTRDPESEDDATTMMILRPNSDTPLLIEVYAACY